MLDYGFNGYQIPAVPRACRSPRGRVPVRKKCEKNQRHDEFDILARVAEKFSGKCENRASAYRLRQETEEVEEETEAKNDGFVVSNFLETMEHGVEHVSVIGSENNLQESLSKDWLALGPSRSQSCISQLEYGDRLNQKDGSFSKSGKRRRASGSKIDCRVYDSSSAKADEFGYKSKNFSTPRNCKRVPDSNIEHWTNDRRSNEVDQKTGTLIGLGNWKRTSNSNKIDRRADDPTGADKLDQKKTGNWNRVSDSKLDGKRKLCSPKERSFSETNSPESESIYPVKKRKFYHHNNLFESLDSPVQKRSAPQDHDCNVKFSIKSFKIPELFIDIPVSATVGSLKMTVMEAMMQILKNGLDVGVVLQGKKIRDDSKTLIQTEISGDDKNSSLGFTLEPRKPETTSSTPETFTGDSDVAGHVENKGEALAVVPYRRKLIRRPETIQRRIRRPFTVSEVEALVQAVERLGTGRWRDVKSRAFDQADHRTYVDLKDKWKTLVHTARISPRQRRGEPVPQELLDRVLAAHAFWSDRQTELKLKPSP